LRSSGNEHVYLFKTPDRAMINGKKVKLWHARLAKLPAYKKAVNAFCARYKFPHSEKLASGYGQELECYLLA
jgi:hypothetical protein